METGDGCEADEEIVMSDMGCRIRDAGWALRADAGCKMKETTDNKRLLIYLLLGWMVLNFIQAAVTGLFDDEALFWIYGRHLAWGYYENPPVVGILIRAGYELFNNELGLRFFFVILNTLSFYLIARLAMVKNPLLFASLAFTAIVAQAAGFIASPDAAQIFFTVLFFMIYQKFLEKGSASLAVLWGVVMAAMMYTRYSGVLIILFTIMSNYRLLKTRSFYIAAASMVICMIPYVLWSFRNDHPAIYDLFIERNFEQFNFLRSFGGYFLGQLLLYGPLMAFVFFRALIVFKAENTFDKSLKFTAIGMFMFFMACSFRGTIEPGWTAPAFVPLLIIAYRTSLEKINAKRWIFPLAAISMVIVAGIRIYIVYDFLKLPGNIVNPSELYGWKEWAKEVETKSGGRPVLFLNSDPAASKYIFYTGMTAYSVNDYAEPRSQYYYWSDDEKNLQGHEIMVAGFESGSWFPAKKTFISGNHTTTYYDYCKNFRSHYKLGIRFKLKNLRFPANASIILPLTIVNPYPSAIRFNENMMMRTWLVYHIRNKDNFVSQFVPGTEITDMVIQGACRDTSIRFITPTQPGNYYFWVSVCTGWLPPDKNMNVQSMEIF